MLNFNRSYCKIGLCSTALLSSFLFTFERCSAIQQHLPVASAWVYKHARNPLGSANLGVWGTGEGYSEFDPENRVPPVDPNISHSYVKWMIPKELTQQMTRVTLCLTPTQANNPSNEQAASYPVEVYGLSGDFDPETWKNNRPYPRSDCLLSVRDTWQYRQQERLRIPLNVEALRQYIYSIPQEDDSFHMVPVALLSKFLPPQGRRDVYYNFCSAYSEPWGPTLEVE